tara:strand:- start:229 stop:765 length:537 start_codon:yes stop_codon:yes gene_type:complete
MPIQRAKPRLVDLDQTPLTAMPVGSIIQTKQTVVTDHLSIVTGSTPAAITGMNVSITPASSSNKIMILANIVIGHNTHGNHQLYLYRDSTAVGIGIASSSSPRATVPLTNRAESQYECIVRTINYLDSPSTTSAITYALYASDTWNGEAIKYNRPYNSNTAGDDGSYISTITAMEIKG